MHNRPQRVCVTLPMPVLVNACLELTFMIVVVMYSRKEGVLVVERATYLLRFM